MTRNTTCQNAGAEDRLEPAPSQPESIPHSSPSERARLEAALRDLISRVEHVRSVIRYSAAVLDMREIVALLDTGDAREALGLARPMPASACSAAE
jgi:hypothetical protein